MGKKFTGGYIGSLDESQQKVLAEMYEEFKEWKVKVDEYEGVFQLDDRFMLKFLRARDFDLKKASDMLTKHLEFREKWQQHKLTLQDEDVKLAMENGSWRMAGEDKKGHPLQLIQVNKFIPKEVRDVEQYTKGILYQREVVLKKLELDGWKAETSTVMFDMAGWSLFTHGSPLGMSYTRILIDVAQNHYPEVLEQAIIFNAPFVFRTGWAIIKPWLDPVTAARVIFVSDPKQLHDIIDPSVLNERYGGTRKEEYPNIPDYILAASSPSSSTSETEKKEMEN